MQAVKPERYEGRRSKVGKNDVWWNQDNPAEQDGKMSGKTRTTPRPGIKVNYARTTRASPTAPSFTHKDEKHKNFNDGQGKKRKK